MTAGGQREHRPVERSARDAVWAVIGVAVLVGTAVVASDQRVPGWERAAFDAVNERDVLPYAVVWPVMQLGNVLVVVVGAVTAAATRRFRAAAVLLAGGLLAYWLAKAVKGVVERPRPAGLIDDVAVRGPHVADNGFVSGHATVAVVVVALLAPYVGRRTAAAFVVLAALVGLSRLYVGAHLPLDVVGGAALAVTVASLVHLVAGRARSHSPPRSTSAAVSTGA
jgi:membrane-associated phospholipid phosphatase